jgi:glyoxylase-like metal-dependent hydrolase (beta-lactamase superfamily II)
MRLITLFCTLTLPVILFAHNARQNQGDDVEIKITHVAGNIYMLQGRGGNIGVSAGEDGILVVDDQFDYLSAKIKDAIKTIHPGEIKYLFNTHHHGDHTGGNKNFGGEATIIAHHNVRKRLSADSSKTKIEFPVITFEEGVSVHFNDEEIKAVHLAAGHTDGDVAIYFTKSNVIHMGDQFFNGGLPFIDLASGGNVENYAENLLSIMKIIDEDTKIIPGHGELTDISGLRDLHTLLSANITYVKDMINKGKSLEEIQKSGVLPPYKERANNWMTEELWLKILYSSLTGKASQ